MKNRVLFIFGLALIFIAIYIIAIYNHDYLEWGNVKTGSIFLSIVGIVICLPSHSQLLPEFKNRVARIIINLLLMIFMIGFVEKVGESLNNKITDYCLNKDSVTTYGLITKIASVRYSIKRSHYEKFVVFEYETPNQIIEQGIKLDDFNSIPHIGNYINITYSRSSPKRFRIRYNTNVIQPQNVIYHIN